MPPTSHRWSLAWTRARVRAPGPGVSWPLQLAEPSRRVTAVRRPEVSRVGDEACGPGAVVLLSGGLDSATTLAIAVSQGYTVDALTFLYGQRHEREVEAATALADAMRDSLAKKEYGQPYRPGAAGRGGRVLGAS